MNQPNEEVVRAIIGLSNNPNFDVFVDWLRDSLISQSVQNNHKLGEVAIRAAGGNIELENILKHIDSAQDYLINIKQAQKP
jgi:hypothetical protein